MAKPRITAADLNGSGEPVSPRRALLRLTAKDLQHLMSSGSLTSENLVHDCLQQIDFFDRDGAQLHAMISVAPREILLARARELDLERQDGRIRGPLHGIPIILKDIIDTDPFWQLPTTQGAKVLEHALTFGQSTLVEKLLQAGLVIIGKANLSEFGAGKGEKGIGGLSALGGQAKSVYVREELRTEDKGLANPNPGGSSTGSAIAVAAGYSPISIGGEADGSLTTPASRAALYALKCTPQTISTKGIFQVVPTFETVGGMAKSVQDLVDVTQIILQAATDPREVQVRFQSDWRGIKLGFVDPVKWKLPEFLFESDEMYCAEIGHAIKQAIDLIRHSGGTVHYPVEVIHPDEINFKGSPGYLKVLSGEFRDSVNDYLAGLFETPVRSLAEIIHWNEKHPEQQAGIDQSYFITAQNDTSTPQELAEARAYVKCVSGQDSIFKTMNELQLNAICAPTDGPICTVAAMAGCPTACVPLGYLQRSGRPFGLSFIARPGEEDTLLLLMSAWEATFPAPRLPPVLLDFLEQAKL